MILLFTWWFTTVFFRKSSLPSQFNFSCFYAESALYNNPELNQLFVSDLISEVENKSFFSSACSEGVFKCPEDQLPLDYAKVVMHSALISHAFCCRKDYSSISHSRLHPCTIQWSYRGLVLYNFPWVALQECTKC